MKKFFDKILKPYERASLAVKLKSRLLLKFSLFMLTVAISTLFILFFIDFDITTTTSILFSGGIYLTGILLISRGRYHAASNLVIIALGLVFTATPFFLSGKTTLRLLSMQIYLILFALIISVFIGSREWQPMAVAGIGSVGITGLTFVYVLPGAAEEDLGGIWFAYLTGLLILMASGFFCRCVTRLYDRVISVAREEGNKNKKRVYKLRGILKMSGKSMQVGQQLTESAGHTYETVSHIDNNLKEIKASIEASNRISAKNQELTDEMAGNVEVLRDTMTQQSRMTSESSMYIEAMIEAMENILKLSEAKRVSIKDLVDTARVGQEEVIKAVESIKNMEESSETMMQMNQMITGVAALTNLLAMNAAIEAAHAGEAGRGFSVVADEIRNLAETTSSNTKEISRALKKNVSDIKAAAEINIRASNYFMDINTKIAEVTTALSEITNGMAALTDGSRDVIGQIKELVSTSQNANSAIGDMDSLMELNRHEAKSIAADSHETLNRVAEVVDEFRDIVKETDKIKAVGEENISHIKDLEERLSEF